METILEVEFNERLTPKSCSLIVKQLIKYIVYNTQQIPFTYDGILKLIDCTKNLSESLETMTPSMKVMKANLLYKDIEKQFNNFESIFQSIEEELSRDQTIKEIVLIQGTTLLCPKHIFRIRIPLLCHLDTQSDAVTRKNLCSLYRHIIQDYDRIFFSGIGPTNTYVLIHSEREPISKFFVPKHNFSIGERLNSTVFSFNTPHSQDSQTTVSACFSDSENDFSFSRTQRTVIHNPPDGDDKAEEEIDPLTDLPKWYQAKEMIKGFQDFNIEGVSVFSVISNLVK